LKVRTALVRRADRRHLCPVVEAHERGAARGVRRLRRGDRPA